MEGASVETPRGTTQAEPDIRKRYQEMLDNGRSNIEEHMKLLWELSLPTSLDPSGGAGTGKSGVDPLGEDGEGRVLRGEDFAVVFYMGDPEWRAKARNDRKLRGSMLFWNVLVERRDVWVDNPGFAPGFHREYRSPLAVLRDAGVVEKDPKVPGRWVLAA